MLMWISARRGEGMCKLCGFVFEKNGWSCLLEKAAMWSCAVIRMDAYGCFRKGVDSETGVDVCLTCRIVNNLGENL
jgi:hypothetical protein